MFESFLSNVLAKLPRRSSGPAIKEINDAGFYFLASSIPPRSWNTVASVHAFTVSMPVGYELQLAVSFLDGKMAIFSEGQKGIWEAITTQVHTQLGSSPYEVWAVKLIEIPGSTIELFQRTN